MHTASLSVSLFTGYLIADEFLAELATGAAYVAGHDVEGRPILVNASFNKTLSSGFPTSSHCMEFTESVSSSRGT